MALVTTTRFRDLYPDADWPLIDRQRRARYAREARRERKTAKNLYMYRTFGRRPWKGVDIMLHMPFMLRHITSYKGRHECMRSSEGQRIRMEHLREDSGFKSMSKIAAQFEVNKQ